MIASLLHRMRNRLKRIFGPSDFLCDTCRYDWGTACRRPERPNAKQCDDYEPRG
jgi:hypothetical protein